MRKRIVQEPLVSIVDAAGTGNCIDEALNLIGAGSLIKEGNVVVITANMVDNKAASTGTVVHPDLLRKIIRYIKAKSLPG
jgi:uncharacterized protein (DUF362 family)